MTMSEHTRREFLKTVAAAGAVSLAAPRGLDAATERRSIGANDRIRIGVVGTGGRARHLMRLLKDLPGCEMVAVSDVYEPRIVEAAEIAGTTVGAMKVRAHRGYEALRKLLGRTTPAAKAAGGKP